VTSAFMDCSPKADGLETTPTGHSACDPKQPSAPPLALLKSGRLSVLRQLRLGAVSHLGDAIRS